MRILVIEDEILLTENVASAFRDRFGSAVDCAYDGLDGESMAHIGHYDLMIVDLMLPGRDGLTVVRNLRERKNVTPILILTAREERSEVVRLLNAGADDYLTKPFDLGELLARGKALVRRASGIAQPVVCLGRLTVNSVEQIVRWDEDFVELSPTEYRILEYFSFRVGALVSKRDLLEHLYDFRWENHSNVIEAHISNLRRKLRLLGDTPAIETLHGRGYRLSSPDSETSSV